MPRLPPEIIQGYLLRLDGFLTRPVRLVVIGGFAIALGWCDRHSTSDIDVLGQLDPELQQAIQAAGTEGAVPIQSVFISSQPYDFEDRLQPVEIPGLKRLQVFLPEAHDLAIMKLARGLSHDLEGIEAIHQECPLGFETPIERYRNTDHIGSPAMFRLSLLAAVSRLFGDEVAGQLDQAL